MLIMTIMEGSQESNEKMKQIITHPKQKIL
jgi:hypothetical protein